MASVVTAQVCHNSVKAVHRQMNKTCVPIELSLQKYLADQTCLVDHSLLTLSIG